MNYICLWGILASITGIAIMFSVIKHKKSVSAIKNGTYLIFSILMICLGITTILFKRYDSICAIFFGITFLNIIASVVSNGMLGWIAGDDESIFEAQLEMSRSKALAEQIRLNIAKRAIVFPTGAEVEAGEIEDTNTPFIMQKLTEAGFTVDKGEVMKDDLRLFTAGLSRAAEMGYGL